MGFKGQPCLDVRHQTRSSLPRDRDPSEALDVAQQEPEKFDASARPPLLVRGPLEPPSGELGLEQRHSLPRELLVVTDHKDVVYEDVEVDSEPRCLLPEPPDHRLSQGAE